MTFLALDILKSGVTLSMVGAVLGLLFAFLLIKAVIRLSPGNDRMRQIAGAVEEGAKAYLKRQVKTLSAEGRLSALILMALPFFMAGFFFLFRRDYLAPLWTDPLGWLMLGVVAVLMVLGGLWMRGMVKAVAES